MVAVLSRCTRCRRDELLSLQPSRISTVCGTRLRIRRIFLVGYSGARVLSFMHWMRDYGRLMGRYSNVRQAEIGITLDGSVSTIHLQVGWHDHFNISLGCWVFSRMFPSVRWGIIPGGE